MKQHQPEDKAKQTKLHSALIAGCGRMGSTLAGSLSAKGYGVTIIDTEPGAFRKLPPAFSGFQIIGNATDIAVLERAGIEEADLFIAAADLDNVNSMIGQIASVIYGIPKVYIRLYDTDKKRLLESTSIKAIFPAKLSIREFEELSNIQIQEEA